MSDSRVNQLKNLGIKIELTEKGCETLSNILNDGCPIKVILDTYEPISCQYHYDSGRYACKRCWKKWLKNFIVKE